MWSQVFVKAMPNRITLINSCLSVGEDVLYLVSFSVFVPTFTM